MIPKVKSDEGFFDRGNQRRLSNPLQMEEKASRVSMEEQNEDYTEIGAQLQLINQLMHEIRNELSPPLDYMVNQQQILFDENLSAEEKIEQIKKENCRRHINALLEIDRILEGRSLVYRMAMGLYNEIERSLDLRELLLDTVAKVRTVQPEKFSIQVLVPDGLGTCLDPIAIQYSIESLIAHAIAHEATSVKIDYLSETSALRFRSNGKQIKMQDRSHILDNASLFGASRGTDFRLASSQFILDKVACSLQFFFWDQGEEQITDAIIQLPMKKVFKAQPPSRPALANQIPQQDTEILFLQHHLTEMHPCMNNIKRVSSSSSLGSIDQFSTGLSIDISSSSESIAFHHQPNSSEYRSSPASIAKVCTPRCRRFVSSRDRSITSLSKLSQRQLQRIVVVILDDSRAIRFQICRLWKKLCSDLSIELIIHQYSSYEEITTNFFSRSSCRTFFYRYTRRRWIESNKRYFYG
mmetsp:Transcript_11397/g.17015  ORF Transcript_11397/g.17015 Transcript_11397/m.17015 type:complete len:467 (+) Transcript_11397:66-1466(+)